MTFYDDTNLDIIQKDLRYLQLLANQHPNISSASTEIVNLQAIMNLPKSTEHFISDIHGEYESFTHMLKNASGVIRRKIDDVFGDTITSSEKNSIATLIYYPEQKLELIKADEENLEDWYRVTIYRLIELCRVVSSKYTRSKVRKALPIDFSYIIEELLHEHRNTFDKQDYYNGIISTIIDIDRASEFIAAISKVIQRLAVDRLHIVGDIYDRGPGPEIIIEALINHHAVDIQWGNHDLLWMGAASGSEACICNVLRIALRYANLNTIEDGYGVNLLPLATFALEYYGEDPCKRFIPKTIDKDLSHREKSLIAKMHKAIAIIQFKLEGQLIHKHPEFLMDDQPLLHKIDYEMGTVYLNGEIYKLNDTSFPTINPEDPYKLTPGEDALIKKLQRSFIHSEKLQRHIRFLYSKGSMYLIYNSNLLYHGDIPLNEDGTFKEFVIDGIAYAGKSLLDKFDQYARDAYFGKKDSPRKEYGLGMIWYLWCGPNSPEFGKHKMTTFERYFIDDKKTHIEIKDPYYKFRDDEKVIINILREFKLDPDRSHIVNGHIPVKSKGGESPIKANGKLLVIDGGFCRAYQPETGIAGYTLIYNSYGLLLSSHEPFESIREAIEYEKDIVTSTVILEHSAKRKRVADTDIGTELRKQIKDLQMLLTAYRKGLIKEIK